MVRAVLQTFVTFFLLVMLGVGGKTTACALISLAGKPVHHHTNPVYELEIVTCVEAHLNDLSGDIREKRPCKELCKIPLSKVIMPGSLLLPSLNAKLDPPALEGEWINRSWPVVKQLMADHSVDSLEIRRAFITPSFTGRFLI